MNIISSINIADLQISERLVSLRGDLLNQFFFGVTKIGDWYIICTLIVIFVVALYIYKKQDFIVPLLVTVVSAEFVIVILKYLVGRARPSGNISLFIESSSSFPSAHAALSLAFFGFIIYCVNKLLDKKNTKIIVTSLLLLLIILIGFSRIYLGVHFLSDVLAGYLFGFLCLYLTVHFLHKKRQV